MLPARFSMNAFSKRAHLNSRQSLERVIMFLNNFILDRARRREHEKKTRYLFLNLSYVFCIYGWARRDLNPRPIGIPLARLFFKIKSQLLYQAELRAHMCFYTDR